MLRSALHEIDEGYPEVVGRGLVEIGEQVLEQLISTSEVRDPTGVLG